MELPDALQRPLAATTALVSILPFHISGHPDFANPAAHLLVRLLRQLELLLLQHHYLTFPSPCAALSSSSYLRFILGHTLTSKRDISLVPFLSYHTPYSTTLSPRQDRKPEHSSPQVSIQPSHIPARTVLTLDHLNTRPCMFSLLPSGIL